ncbi:MAG: NAD(P)H-dependent oxidoreductase [Alphaproteobacteria bacterium]|nr:NAD(P)H-dependent oxidoreductase [Alphaproteobacteria bacterium]
MRSVLFVSSSLMSETSKSRQIAAELLAAMTDGRPDIRVTERHLQPDTIPHLSGGVLAALGTPAEQRSTGQQAAVDFADRLIAEVEGADVMVIAAPMYNFSIPSTLKAWLDHIARAGRTFRYTASGPQGLLGGKQLYVVASRGGYYAGESPARVMDFQEPYLRAFFGFLGIRDVKFIYVEGQAVSPEAAAKGVAAARADIGSALTSAA